MNCIFVFLWSEFNQRVGHFSFCPVSFFSLSDRLSVDQSPAAAPSECWCAPPRVSSPLYSPLFLLPPTPPLSILPNFSAAHLHRFYFHPDVFPWRLLFPDAALSVVNVRRRMFDVVYFWLSDDRMSPMSPHTWVLISVTLHATSLISNLFFAVKMFLTPSPHPPVEILYQFVPPPPRAPLMNHWSSSLIFYVLDFSRNLFIFLQAMFYRFKKCC